LLAIGWVSSRSLLYVFATTRLWDVITRATYDVHLYQSWYARYLAHGVFPGANSWQYPPGAAVAFWLPAQFPGDYLRDFALLAIGADLAVLVMLIWRARRGGSLLGACYWTVGVPLAGPLLAMRFDVFSVALAVAALCVAGAPIGRGVLAGAGAMIKVWPATVVLGLPPGQVRRGAVAFGATAAAVVGSFVFLMPGALGFLDHQGGRGVEVESVAVTPFLIARHFGWHGVVALQYGSFQLAGAHVALAWYAAEFGLVLSVMAAGSWRLLIARGRLRWRPEFQADAPLAATLLLISTSRVLSPQYVLWVTGLAACCLAAERSTQRPVAVALLAVDALTTVVYPLGFARLIEGSDLMTVTVAVRNGLLLVVTAWSCWRLLRASLAESRKATVRPASSLHPGMAPPGPLVPTSSPTTT
jgi:Glycosyltransferase family 87